MMLDVLISYAATIGLRRPTDGLSPCEGYYPVQACPCDDAEEMAKIQGANRLLEREACPCDVVNYAYHVWNSLRRLTFT